ncbi:PREDICTED: uncharacterized protein LOC101292201 [Fragaria vesca subsp. vesca]
MRNRDDKDNGVLFIFIRSCRLGSVEGGAGFVLGWARSVSSLTSLTSLSLLFSPQSSLCPLQSSRIRFPDEEDAHRPPPILTVRYRFSPSATDSHRSLASRQSSVRHPVDLFTDLISSLYRPLLSSSPVHQSASRQSTVAKGILLL